MVEYQIGFKIDLVLDFYGRNIYLTFDSIELIKEILKF